MMTLNDIIVLKTMILNNKRIMSTYVHINFVFTMVLATIAAVVFALFMGVFAFFKEAYDYIVDDCPDAFKECYEEYKDELKKYDNAE